MIPKLKMSINALSKRDKRAVFLGLIALTAIMIYMGVVLPVLEGWSSVRIELKSCQDKLDLVGGSTAGTKAKIVGLYRTVPFVELPEKEDVQRKLFWEKTYDQLKKSGVNISSGPSYLASAKKKTSSGQQMLRLELSGSCKYEQMLKFLAALNENPYLVSVEELSIATDKKSPEKVNIKMVMGTFVK